MELSADRSIETSTSKSIESLFGASGAVISPERLPGALKAHLERLKRALSDFIETFRMCLEKLTHGRKSFSNRWTRVKQLPLRETA